MLSTSVCAPRFPLRCWQEASNKDGRAINSPLLYYLLSGLHFIIFDLHSSSDQMTCRQKLKFIKNFLEGNNYKFILLYLLAIVYGSMKSQLELQVSICVIASLDIPESLTCQWTQPPLLHRYVPIAFHHVKGHS